MKNSIVGIGLAVVLFGGWYVWQSFVQTDQDASLQQVAVQQTRQFRSILNDLSSISIDAPLLQDESFLKMKDYSQTITPREVGRSNPFQAIE